MSSDLLVELDEKENLEACQINADPLVHSPFSYFITRTLTIVACLLSVILDLR